MGWRHRYGLRKWNLFEKLALISYSWIGKRRSSLTETLLLQSRKVFQLLLEPWRVSRGWEMVPSWWSVVRGPRPKTCSRPTIFIDRSVRVSVHKTLNSSRGVTRCRDLVDMLEVEIQDELKDQGVAGVNWVILKKEGKMIPTNTLEVQFSGIPERDYSQLYKGEGGLVCSEPDVLLQLQQVWPHEPALQSYCEVSGLWKR